VVVLVMLGLHSGMDFDWGYPALLAMLAPVAALAGPPGGDRGTAVRARYAVALVGLGVVLLAAGAVGGWGGGLDLSATVA
jgi:hypothetical protein